MIVLRQLDMNDTETLEQLWYLQQSAYRIEADLLGFDRIPPLMDTIDDLRHCKEIFYGWWDEAELMGAISYEVPEPDVIDICRLMVHPRSFRQGIGSRLLEHVLQITGFPIHRIATGARNTPALRLYERAGFQFRREEEIAPGVYLHHLERVLKEDGSGWEK